VKNKLIAGIGILLIVVAGVVLLSVKKSGKLGVRSQVVAETGGSSSSASELLARAKEFEAKGNLLDAKKVYQELTANFAGSGEIMNWQKKLEDLNIKLLFSPVITPKSILYEIKPGDSLVKIAKEFKTTPELIAKANNLISDKIFPGKKIKVWAASLSIVVDKSQNILMLKSDEDIIKTYIVSTGANNSTPVGTFKITSKLPNPTWFKAGAVVPSDSPENVLGTRWLGFELSGYGIHGTIEPQNLGKQVTQGCVRMANSDVEELYAIVPQGTEVTIVD
jgi:lipoprotein-anchoring transpeptidase ErfK/SrfK